MKKLADTPDVTEVPAPKPARWKHWLLIVGIGVGSFALLNLGIWGMYYARAYPGVVVGGQGVGNLDSTAVASRLNMYTANYVLKITVKGESQEVVAQDIDLTFEQQVSARNALAKGKSAWLPLYGLIYTWKNGAVDVSYTLNQQKLDQVASKLAGSNSVAPTDAKVVIEGEAVRVEADKPGQGVDPKLVAALIKTQVAKGQRQASISERATEAAISTKEATVMVAAAQQALKTPVSITINGKQYIPAPVEIGKWLTVTPDKDGKLVLGTNADALNAYVATIAAQVDVAAVNKQINMVNGEVKTVKEGKNGSALDRQATASALSKAIITGSDPALTGVMSVVAFKNITNNTVDLEGKYIEINLSRQRLWAYDNKQLVFESPITSGATGAGFATIQGLFSVKAKQTNRNLNGVPLGFDYNVFVNYWIPFSGNYGMHDASWRSSFGGQDYYYGGSHGCVNLPAASAAWVYNFVLVGTPVWVHS